MLPVHVCASHSPVHQTLVCSVGCVYTPVCYALVCIEKCVSHTCVLHITVYCIAELVTNTDRRNGC